MRESLSAMALCVLWALLAGCGGGPEPEATAEQVQAAVTGSNDFAARFYARAGDDAGNLCIFAHGLRTALAVPQAGARKQTSYEMAGVVGIPRGRDDLHEAAGVLARRLRRDEGWRSFRLRRAEAVLVRAGRTVMPDYRKLIELCYDVRLRRAGLGDPWRPVIEATNEWAGERTGGAFTSLLPPDAAPNVGMVVSAAGTVEGRWEEPFDEDLTARVPFQVAEGEPVRRLALHGRARFGRAEFDEVPLLELPYRGGRFSLVVMVPSERLGLAGLRRRLRANADALESWLAAVQPEETGVVLPVFRVESAVRAEGVLADMGLEESVTMAADFSGMVGEPGLALSVVMHRATLSVHEGGSGGEPEEPGPAPVPEMQVDFRADRPFAFLLRHVGSGVILFIGQVTDPAAG